MPRPKPHPLALFSLIPINGQARAVVAHPMNEHLVSIQRDGMLGLDVGHVRLRPGNVIAILGRGEGADVYIEGPSISKVQCSFEIDPGSNVVMLYDRSHGQTTQVYGEDAIPFEHGRTRKVVVDVILNTQIRMGGQHGNFVQFKLRWHHCFDDVKEKILSRENIPLGYEENPRLARTIIDEADTHLFSGRETRLHTPGPRQLKMRYVKIGDKLGAGAFAEVFKAINVDSGELMAVKILKSPVGKTEKDREKWRRSMYYALKREVEILARIKHPRIVNFITSQGWDGPAAEIFMGLKEGTLASLLRGRHSIEIAESAFHHIFQALDCLAINGIVHRDVKPENILYVSGLGSKYEFQLGDFGLSNLAVCASSSVGSPLYMAPEIRLGKEQTHKVDIWSLFITMMWALDIGRFRERCGKLTLQDIYNMVHDAASTNKHILVIGEMANMNPEGRPSAAQMLVKCFDGLGMSTPRNEVPPLNTTPQPEGKGQDIIMED